MDFLNRHKIYGMNKSLAITMLSFLLAFSSCSKQRSMEDIIDESLSFAVEQYGLMAEVMKEKPDLLPRTIDTTGALVTAGSGWWTAGFFPGSLWYLYEYSGDSKIRDARIILH